MPMGESNSVVSPMDGAPSSAPGAIQAPWVAGLPGGLEEVRERFWAFVCHSAYGYAEIDLEGRLLCVNSRLADWLGELPDRLLGRPFEEFLDPAERAGARAGFALALEQPVDAPKDYTLVAADGSRRTVSVTSVPLHEQERTARLLVMVLDVTQRHSEVEALGESAARLLYLMENMPDAVLLADRDGQVLFINRALPGQATEDLVGKPHWDLIRPEHRDSYQAACRQAIETRESRSIEVVTLGGRWWDVQLVPLGAGPAAEHLMVIATDVTVGREAARDAKRTQQQLRAISEAALDAVLMIDHRGRLIHWNPGAERMFGHRADEALGQDAHELLAPQRYRSEARTGLDKFALFGGGPVVGQSLEVLARRKDGSEFPGELSVSAVMLDGQWCAVGILRDITERKRAEQALREREQRYSELLAAVTTYTYSVRLADGVPVGTEHGPGCLAATGYAPEDYQADPYLWITMVHPEDRESVRQHVSRILARERVPPLEHRIIHRDGSVRWVRDTVMPHYQDGSLVRYDGLIEDVTERKRAEAALRDNEARLLAAQQIQARLLPTGPPDLPGYDVAGISLPADFTGGDYFDYLPMGDGCVGFVVGDVSGHGLGPALVMALTHAHFRSLSENHSIPEILGETNRFLVSETDHFITVFFARLEPATRRFVYVNAGHPPGCVLDTQGNVKARLGATALPLAVAAESAFAEGPPLVLSPGDLVLLLTDGVTESCSPKKDLFGMARALQVVRAHRHRSAAEIIAAISSAVWEFTGNRRPADDVTAMVIKVLE